MSVKSAIKKILPVSLIEKGSAGKQIVRYSMKENGNSEILHNLMLLLNVQIRFRWRAY